MKKQVNVGIELSTEMLADVHGGSFWPYPPGRSPLQLIVKGATEVGKVVGQTAKSVWDTVTSWF
ncbi:MAG: hypothetical protein RL033_1048 [Pseudomonadota bacterium]|jgi:hypothetical protein